MRSPSIGMVEDPYSASFHKSHGKFPPGAHPIEGLRMSQPTDTPFAHRPVMVDDRVGVYYSTSWR